MTWPPGGRVIAGVAITMIACSPEDTGTLVMSASDEGGMPSNNVDAADAISSTGADSGNVPGADSGGATSEAATMGNTGDGSGAGSGGESGGGVTTAANGSDGGSDSSRGSGSGSGFGGGAADGGIDSAPVTRVDAGGEAAAPTVRYATNIAPIVDPTCRDACHGGCGGLTIAYANIVNVKSGEVPSVNYINPTDPGHSYLWCKVNPADTACINARTVIVGARMPADGPPYLSATNLSLIKTWILQGAAN